MGALKPWHLLILGGLCTAVVAVAVVLLVVVLTRRRG